MHFEMSQRVACAALLLTLALPACNDPTPILTKKADDALSKNTLSAPTIEEAQRFARNFEDACRSKDIIKMDEIMQMSRVVQRAVDEFSASYPEANARELRSAGNKLSIGEKLFRRLTEGCNYKFLRVNETANRQHVVFRIVSLDGAGSYHQFVLGRNRDGEVVVEDIVMDGAKLSDLLRRVLLIAWKGLGEKKLKGIDAIYADNFARIDEMMTHARHREFAKCISDYKQLPRELQEDKTLLVFYLRASAMLLKARSDYIEASERFRSLFPDDPYVEFNAFDYHFVKKQYSDALKSINRIDEIIGGDPFLSILRAKALVEMGRFADAKTQIEYAIPGESDLPVLYETRIAVALREKKHDETLEWLKRFCEATKRPIRDLNDAEEFAEFVKSPQHTQWLAWYRENKKD